MKNLAFLFLLITFFSCSQNQSKIYEWRGKDRSGVYKESNLLNEWPESGPAELWATEGIGNGYGSPIITENGIYISGEIDSTAYLFHINLQGKILWKAPFGDEWVKSYPGSRSAPTIVENLIYIGSGKGNLFCLKRGNGEIVWSKDFTTDFQGQYPMFGHSDAAVVSGDKVFWVPGGEKYNVVALNRFTGELIWSCAGFGERSGYTPSKLIKLSNREIFATFSAYNMMGIDAETGKLLWTHQQDNTPPEKRDLGIGDTHSNTPLFENGAIYYAAGDGNCGVKLNLSSDGSQITETWRNIDFDSYMGGIVKIGDYLYGGRTAKPGLLSVNSTTGESVDSLKIGSGALIAADNMLYFYNQKGELFLIKYDQGKLEQKSSFRITKGTKEHFSHPVINNGVLYQRHGNVLMAFDIRGKS